jgi:hypothetical protein
MGREFRYDERTGKAAWVLEVVDETGEILRERCA